MFVLLADWAQDPLTSEIECHGPGRFGTQFGVRLESDSN